LCPSDSSWPTSLSTLALHDALPIYTAGLWIVGEDMPRADNRVTLNDDLLDRHGLPVANVHVDEHPNDLAMRTHAQRQGRAIYERSEEHTSELQSRFDLVCRLLLEKK